jgi:hypothetical protein
MAKMIGFLAMEAIISRVSVPFCERPKTTSAPRIASARLRASVSTHAPTSTGSSRLAAFVDRALGVAEDDVLAWHAGSLDQLHAGDRRAPAPLQTSFVVAMSRRSGAGVHQARPAR